MTTESSTTFTSAAGSRSSFAIVGALALLTMVVTSPVSSASRAEAAAGVEEYRLVIHRSKPHHHDHARLRRAGVLQAHHALGAR